MVSKERRLGSKKMAYEIQKKKVVFTIYSEFKVAGEVLLPF